MQEWCEVVYETDQALSLFLKNMGRGNPEKKPAGLDADSAKAWDLATELRNILQSEDFDE